MTRKREKLQGKCTHKSKPQNILEIMQRSQQMSPLPLSHSPKARAIYPPDSFPYREKKIPLPKLVYKPRLFKTCHVILNLWSPKNRFWFQGAVLGKALEMFVFLAVRLRFPAAATGGSQSSPVLSAAKQSSPVLCGASSRVRKPCPGKPA